MSSSSRSSSSPEGRGFAPGAEYDREYRQTADYFGTDPASLLKSHHRRLGRRRPRLDIGAGQGRNALFLARQGFVVDAIDPSAVAIEALSRQAIREGLPVRTSVCGFESFAPETDYYSGILLFGLIPVVSRDSIELLRERIWRWTREGSIILATAFTTADASFTRYTQGSRCVAKNSFADEHGRVRTFLEAGEILECFRGFEVIHYREGTGPLHRHGEALPERHELAEVVLRKGSES
jgi:2-polyprenyl-3-methyl-5-hydroxy-6-metoxy-1,4-benzoquinol methylase